ncbi:MAG: hypothetical protein ABII82_05265 [Verrucomicrobiota bacterium]
MTFDILADCLLYLESNGKAGPCTAAFDADAGTGTNGVLTLIDDNGTHTIVVNSYATLATLVAAINAFVGWKATPRIGLAAAQVTKNDALVPGAGLGRPLADLATTVVPDDGRSIRALIFTNAYELINLSATGTLLTSLALPTLNSQLANLVLRCQGADAGATGFATFNFVANANGDAMDARRVFTLTPDWDTVTLSEDVQLTINGASEVQQSFQIDAAGLPQIKLNTVINGDDAILKVWGSLYIP